MRSRRLLEHVLTPDERYLTMAVFPTMGVGNFTNRPYPLFGAAALSQYCPDEIINQHPRFPTLTANIRQRRTEKVDIRVPLFLDARTRAPDSPLPLGAAFELLPEAREAQTDFSHRALCDSCAQAARASAAAKHALEAREFAEYIAATSSSSSAAAAGSECDSKDSKETSSASSLSSSAAALHAEHPQIHGDCMGFGMGCCCLQVTFQARNLREARHIYDQLAVLAPIFLALTAASPFFRGYLADTDVRWSIISQAVDDRTPFERGVADDDDASSADGSASSSSSSSSSTGVHGRPQQRIAKSRYDSIDCYLSELPSHKAEYDDLRVTIDQPSFDRLRAGGVDAVLARHIAHLFIRDPLVIYKERVELDDARNSDHFENIQSTNWQTVRFKPPPPGVDMGWRVEFRSMEIQLTDFENAAFAVFVALLSRAILFFNLNLYIPISKVGRVALHSVLPLLSVLVFFVDGISSEFT